MNEKQHKRRYTLIDDDISEAITAMAETERRSFCGEVNYLLRLALKAEEEKAG